MNVRLFAATLLVCAGTGATAVAQNVATMPPHVSQFNGSTRGYFFTAPHDMRIVGVQVLQGVTTNSHQNWAIVRFHNATPPPLFSSTTNAFDQLALGLDQPSGAWGPCSVDILAGEVIGIYGNTAVNAGTTSGGNSYTGGSQPTTTLFGTSVDLFRSGMQFHLGSATSPQGMHDIWQEVSFSVSRVEFQYEALGSSTTIYCTAKVTSSGCVPSIGSTGSPTPTGAFTATCTDVEVAQLGVLFYGTSGPAAIVFQDGFLCVSPPVIRLPFQNSGGAALCSGTYSRDLTGVITAMPPGQQINCQFWFRDPGAASGTGLSNGLQFNVQ